MKCGNWRLFRGSAVDGLVVGLADVAEWVERTSTGSSSKRTMFDVCLR